MKSSKGKKALKEAFGIDMEKPFPCFTTQLTYTEDSPFRCDFCGCYQYPSLKYKGLLMSKKLYSFLHPQARRVPTVLDPADHPDPARASKTQSEFARELDVNYLVEKHIRSGIPFPVQSLDEYRDVSNLPDFQDAQQAVITARESWYRLDAKVRRHFGDRPENFLEAIHDPNRVDELVRLKIIKKPAVKAPEEPSKGLGGPAQAKPAGGAKAPGTEST